MATESYQTQLERVQAAIAAIESGSQEYSIGAGTSRTVKRGDLSTLYEREKYLRVMAERETNGGINVRHATPATGR